MNRDIEKMIELQDYWNAVLAARKNIDRAGELLRSLERDAATITQRCELMDASIRDIKQSIKRNELDLKDMEGRIARLEERRMNIRTERELNALDKEIDVIRFDIGSLEEKTIALMDELEKKEGERSSLEEERLQRTSLVEKERPKVESEMNRHQEIARIHEERFAAGVDSVAAAYRSKFVKMIGSREGTGIARLDGEICGFCNFKVPAHLAIQAGRDDSVTTCTNCGKYIYR